MNARSGAPLNSTRLAELFAPMPLPRWRAIVALVFAAAALLSLGGALSYASGSPDLHGPAAPRYWAAFFAYYTAAFGGAAALGAFPRLSRLSIKGGWLLLTGLLLRAALAIRFAAVAGPVEPSAWWPVMRPYVPALVPLIAGMCWRRLREPED